MPSTCFWISSTSTGNLNGSPKHCSCLWPMGSEGKRDQWLKTVRAVKPTEASAALLKTLEQAFKAIDYDAYDKAWKRLGQVLELKPAFEERKKLLQQLSEVAPRWAEAISLAEPPQDAAEPPGNLDKAWTHRQLAQKLMGLGGLDIEKLEDRVALIGEKGQKGNALYVGKLAWRAQLERKGLKQH